MKPSTSKAFAPCLHWQRTSQPPGKCCSGPNAVNRPKRFKQYQPAESTKKGQEQDDLTHSKPISIIENPLN